MDSFLPEYERIMNKKKKFGIIDKKTDQIAKLGLANGYARDYNKVAQGPLQSGGLLH